MKEKNSALKAGIGYTIGNIFVKGINFLAIPFFSRIMTTEEFGIYNVFLSYDAILCVLVGMALHTSIRSANYEFKDRIDDYTSSISVIYLINSLIVFGIVLMGGSMLSKLFDLSSPVLFLLVIYSFAGAVISLYNERISLDFAYKKYLLVSVLNSLGNIVVSLVLMFTLFSKERELGRIWGTTITILVIAVGILVNFFKKSKPRYKKEYWRFGIKYSLPIVPHGISQVLLAQFDRIMISNMVSNAAAGIYSLAGNIKLILTIITTSISTAWSTWFYSKIENNEIETIKQYAKRIVRLFAVFTIGLMAISPELIMLLGGKGYETGKYVAIPMIIDAFILFIYSIIVPSEYHSKKTTYIMWGTVIATVINIVANMIFIDKYGFIAAAYTTLFAYICYLGLHLIISYRVVRFNILSIKMLTVLMSIIGVSATVDLYFIDELFIRYVYAFFTVILLLIGIIKDFLERR